RIGLVAGANFVLNVKPNRVTQVGLIAILALALGEQLDAAGNEKELVAHAVGFNRDVVSEVPTLEQPRGQEVRLKLGYGTDHEFQFVPLIFLLLLDSAHPEGADSKAARASEA